jgi:hypothetical protein
MFKEKKLNTLIFFFKSLLLVGSISLLAACGGGGGGGGSVPVPDGGDFLISWDANREFSVNSPGGGYRVYYSTNPGFDISTAYIVDVPFVSGSTAPTSIVTPLYRGTNYIKVVAYSALNTAGSQPSQESSIDVPY